MLISPGSRSTPLTLSAAVHPGLQKHVVLDERSAAFTALGIAKATGFPALLVCTSGTATANYLPALVEARQSGVPVIVATADRPPRLRNTDANQTIDQRELYGKYCVHFETIEDIPAGAMNSESGNRWDEKINALFDKAVRQKGPVHINFAFDKPLEPDRELLEQTESENKALLREPPPRIEPAGNEEGPFTFPDPVLRSINQSKRPLLIAGPLNSPSPPESLFELARKLNAPLLSEAGFPVAGSAIQGFDGFLRREERCKRLEPDLILRFGRQPASKSLLLALERWKPDTHIFFSRPTDPYTTALPVTRTLGWDGRAFQLPSYTGRSDEWVNRWKEAETKFDRFRSDVIQHTDQLTDGHVYEILSRRIPSEWNLFFSNSFPVRDRSLFGRWGSHTVFTNRGASGIDGITSTAMGTSLGSGRPGILFTGDLAFLHDTNALLNHRLLEQPLLVVVVNNNGGSIFRMLPIAQHEKHFKPYFETPQQAAIPDLCKAYGVGYRGISSPAGLRKLDPVQLAEKSGSHLQVLECQTDPEVSMRLRRKLWEGR